MQPFIFQGTLRFICTSDPSKILRRPVGKPLNLSLLSSRHFAADCWQILQSLHWLFWIEQTEADVFFDPYFAGLLCISITQTESVKKCWSSLFLETSHGDLLPENNFSVFLVEIAGRIIVLRDVRLMLPIHRDLSSRNTVSGLPSQSCHLFLLQGKS